MKLKLDTYTELSLIRDLLRKRRTKIIQGYCSLIPKRKRTLEKCRKIEEMVIKQTNPFLEESLYNKILNQIQNIEDEIQKELKK